MNIPGWGIAILATLGLAAATALVQLSFFLGGVLRRLDDYHEEITNLRKSRHDHAQILTEHEARLAKLEG